MSLESKKNVCSISKNLNVGCVLLVLELAKRYDFDSGDALRYLGVDVGVKAVSYTHLTLPTSDLV